MIITYGKRRILKERLKESEKILLSFPYRYCFITGSFLFKKDYKDIDVFIVSRSKKNIKLANNKIKVQWLDFNDLYSLFFHSVSKTCVAKNILPKKQLKVTVADFWDVINEAIPAIFNEKTSFHKQIRTLLLYLEYFKDNIILDSYELTEKLGKFKNYHEILNYVLQEVPYAIKKNLSCKYIKRFFYTQSGFYKDNLKYEGQRFLYNVAHEIIKVC